MQTLARTDKVEIDSIVFWKRIFHETVTLPKIDFRFWRMKSSCGNKLKAVISGIYYKAVCFHESWVSLQVVYNNPLRMTWILKKCQMD